MKYMGSKNRIAKEILPIILKDRSEKQWYIEPFCGGCNMIDKVNDSKCIANDINEYLIEMFKKLQSGWIPPREISREMYHQIRKNNEKYFKWLVGWAGFNCSYGGDWFKGYAGKTQTKQGIRDYQDEAFRNVMKQVENLLKITFMNLEYDKINYPNNSIIYCDPPYENTTKYLQNNGFKHDKFWEWVREMTKAGHKVFVSEYNAPEDFKCIWEKQVKSSLSANGKIGGNKISTEKLFIYDGESK